MKICIFGAGAVGGYMAVLLKKSGANVSIVARGEHLAAIKKNGLKLVSETGTEAAEMSATDDPAEFGPQDYVISTLKAHQAWESADRIKPLLGASTAVVTAQNGVPWWYFYGIPGQYANMRLESVDPGDRQWQAINPERVIGCTVYPATEIIEPGVIKHISGNAFGLGEPNRKETDRLRALAEIFETAGLKPRIYPEIRNDIWLKLWGNLCFNPISALTRATLDVIATDPSTRAVARNMMMEAERIGRRLGVHFRIDIERRITGAANVGAHRTSMLQDLERGRPLELDALLTAVQEMGRIVDLDTPYIDCVLGLTQQMGRIAGVYPAYPEAATITDAEKSIAD